jgi:biotin operon repressor
MAEPARVIEFKLPKRRPKIVEKVAPPDQRKFAVVPMRAATDVELHGFSVKVLVLLCSYANRAGITWVGQQRIADHLQAPKQQVARAMKQLRDRGHVEVVSKGFRGEKANTVRIVYDPQIKTEDAISIANSKEDSRPPEMVRKEARAMTQQGEDVTRSVTNAPKTVTNSSDLPDQEPEFTEEEMAANRKRLREMLGGLAGRDGFHYNRPEKLGDMMAKKPAPKRTRKTPAIDIAQDVNETPSIDNTIDITGVVQTRKNIGLREVIGLYEDITKHKKTYVTTSETDVRFAELLCQVGCQVSDFEAAVRGLTKPTRLAEVCESLIG